MASLAELQHVVHGQTQRTILEGSKSGYMSKCKVMTAILNRNPEIRQRTLITNDENEAQRHLSKASNIFKLQLPMTAESAKLLFAALSIDDTLPKKAFVTPVIANNDDNI